MNLSYFIFKRITQSGSKGFSPAVFKIAIGSIAIGLAAMIVSFLIMRGFQETVRSKIFGFSGHLTITRFSMGYASEHRPINFHMDVYDHPEKYPLVKHTQEYINKTGLIKTDDEVLGVMVKGVGTRFDTVAFNENLVEGRFIHHPDSGYSNEVVISRTIANKLNANVNDRIVVHFFQNPPRFRRLTITGIYETNLTEYYDSRVILGDIKLLQRLNDWSDSLAEGVEIFIHHPEQIAQVQDQITTYFDENFQEHGDKNVESIEEKFINVFEWLELLNRQINILLVVILIVVAVNMISIILILVMERTQMIGILKALGATDSQVRKIFLYQGINLIIKGLIWGNLIGIGICYLQYKFKIITLNPQNYYMSFVPIGWHWDVVVGLNMVTLLIITIVLFIPTALIPKIQPIKAIRFD